MFRVSDSFGFRGRFRFRTVWIWDSFGFRTIFQSHFRNSFRLVSFGTGLGVGQFWVGSFRNSFGTVFDESVSDQFLGLRTVRDSLGFGAVFGYETVLGWSFQVQFRDNF